MKKILLTLFIGGLFGAMGAILGLHYAPKISKRGIALQKKVCPMFKVSANNYSALETKRNALRKKCSQMEKRLERLKDDSAALGVVEKLLRPEVNLRGSKESVIFQNYIAEKEGLKRAKTKNGLEDMKEEKTVVELRETDNLEIDSKQVKRSNRYCLPRVKKFLDNMSEDFYDEFEEPLTVTSLFRSVELQKKLSKKNGNATKMLDCKGSVHSVGAAVDIKKRGLTGRQLKWLRSYLVRYESAGMIEATEESIQPNFHVMVLAKYKKMG